ncbi:MAG: L,D-transpeptidase family protein [Candidatus Omnitrophica bacterium]|nr:L,D-transpeptidase family protein [Candidatus Omnitrophota bacterium]MBU4302796.1 L,D-transpeptidase family protein [Candidatus Omnitrophota bacterium]MBU4468677.1 L,D-transpeptidase family protein [Candidatus Omnitrophota bacterium]MCG2708221.1 L,D-transpeptidase family protein [Candidatus Omnitrophota bacterium]
MNKKLLIIIIAVLAIAGIFVILRSKKIDNRVQSAKPSSSKHGLFNQARQLEVKGQLLEAKLLYQKLVNDFPESPEVMNWQKKTEDLNIKLLFSPALTPKSIIYQIRPGDTLNKIAREHKTTTELIMKSNNINDALIVPGRKIKVWNAPFNILVDKSQNILMLKDNEEIIKTYTVSTGKNSCTPVGKFKIVNKLPNPTWFKSGAIVPPQSAENVLGTRWMGFDLAGYGIHGTIEPKDLGKQVTQGCVRLSNADVEEIYSIIPVGTEVTIIE